MEQHRIKGLGGRGGESGRTGGAQRLRNEGAGGLLGQRWEVSGGAVKRASKLPALPFPSSLPPPPFALILCLSHSFTLYLDWPTEVVACGCGGARYLLGTGNEPSSSNINTGEVGFSTKL